jgi:hypothetical protein
MFHSSINKALAIACLLSIFGLTFIASAHRQDFRVIEAMLTADDGLSGPCPIKVVFKGYIKTDGPGTVKYTFTRSDGATTPVLTIDFREAGRQPVSTDWTLGDAIALPHFAGWQAIRILSPNSYESNQAGFEINCQAGKEKQPNAQPDAQPAGGRQDQGAEAYQKELPNLAAPYQRKLEQEMTSLKAFAEKFQPALAEAQQKIGFDSTAMNAEFRSISEESDAAKRAQRSAEFQTKYEPQFIELAQSAGIDLAAQRRQMITLLGIDLSKARVKETKTLAIEIEEDRQPIRSSLISGNPLSSNSLSSNTVSGSPPSTSAGELSATSKGSFIACPVKETRTEVTTPLPQPWWNTPQIGKLERVSVQTIAGNQTLVCEYWAYGRSVSIMRAFPEGATHCSAEGSGFLCR